MSDEGNEPTKDERVAALVQELVDGGLTDDQALGISLDVVSKEIRYVFTEGTLDGGAFFDVRSVADKIIIKINVRHPIYHDLGEVLESEISDKADRDELARRLRRANRGLKLLLMAWARCEYEESGDRREMLLDIRTDWGRTMSRFLRGG
ncbi:hypothetical protein [Rhodococcus sp. NPDC049939]|uniref:hypothetical protein n=1 Tax=Rhodococcus sp. NPDC049939 TaxID=3155511 RepID=UPI0033EF737C